MPVSCTTGDHSRTRPLSEDDDQDKDVDAFAAAVTRIGEITPAVCRAHVERYFSSRSMLGGYREIYADLVVGAAGSPHSPESTGNGRPAEHSELAS